MNFPEAVEYLADRAGIIIPQEHQRKKVSPEAQSRREKLLKINAYAAQVYHHQLKKMSSNHYVRQYCEKRGLTSETVDTFQIGFAPQSWDFLVKHLENVKAPLGLAAALGLVRTRKEGTGHFDLFRDRLIFPIISHKGECVGFGGRSFTDEQMPKYLNSPESDLFSKGQTFYGLNETAKFIRAEGFAVVVEGYMDFLSLYSAGIKNVVATLGTALTSQHAKLLKRYTPHVLVLFDGDEAGQNAAARSLPILLEEELLPRAIFLPDRQDPDDFVKTRGVQALQELLKSAPDLFSIVLDRHMREYRGTAADKVRLLDAVSPLLAATRDLRLKDLYISEITQKIGVEPNWVKKHLQKSDRETKLHANLAEKRPSVTPQMPKDVISIGAQIKLSGAPKAELFLLNIALMGPKRLDSVMAEDLLEQMSHSGVKDMLIKAQAYYRQMPNEFAKLSANLMTLTDAPELLGLHMGEPLCSLNEEALDKFMADCARQVKEKYLRNKTRELAASLRTSPSQEQVEMLEQIMNIQKNKHTLRRDRES